MYAPVSPLTKVLNNLQRYSRFYLAGFLTLLLAALLLLSARAQAQHRAAPAASSAQRAAGLARGYGQLLRFSPGQARRFRRCSRQYLASLDSLAQAGALPAATTVAELRYQARAQRLLRPGQFAAFYHLRTHLPASPPALAADAVECL
jgi:hypothetical protein